MGLPILTTKIALPPPLPRVVIRPRLVTQLDAGLVRKLILLSAPAGFGKTTTIREWIADLQQPVAWLTLDPAEQDLSRFLGYLIAALQTITPELGSEALALLHFNPPLANERVVITLLNTIAAQQTDIVLVLDDYHLIASSAMDQLMNFLIEHMPPQLHLVLTTREEPNLALARLRTQHQLIELRAADLCFSSAESSDFLQRVMGLNLSYPMLAALEQYSEGWIVGLQLAALSLQTSNAGTDSTPLFAASQRLVVDYLIEQVLQQQPAQQRNFLIQTAILDRLSGPLCAAVTGQPASNAILIGLERANLFVVPLDAQRQWFRYHHLFAEALRAMFMALPTTDRAALHQRASIWYEDQGLMSDAITHALKAQDFARAATLLEQLWPTIGQSFDRASWFAWIKQLPDTVVRIRPVLSVGYAYGLLSSGSLDAAEARLNDAEAWLNQFDQHQSADLQAMIAVARAYHAQALDNGASVVRYAAHALELTEADSIQRDQALLLLGLSAWSGGKLATAEQAFATYAHSLQKRGLVDQAISPTFVLADIRRAQGKLREAAITLEQLLQRIELQEPLPRDTAELYRALSEVQHQRGDWVAAKQSLLRCQALSPRTTLLDWQRRLYLAEAQLLVSQGEYSQALQLLDQAELVAISIPLPELIPIAGLKARIWIWQGKLIEATLWARDYQLALTDAPTYRREYEHLTLVRLLFAQAQLEHNPSLLQPTLAFLARLWAAAEAQARSGSMIEILLLQALIYQAQDQLQLALLQLKQALSLAEPEQYNAVFLAEGPAMMRLLSAALAYGIRPNYSQQLLSMLIPELAAPLPLAESLTQREREVLALMALGLSNPAIAARLVISVTTVKTHVKNIYAKFQVANRVQAIARAKVLGWL